MSTKRFQEGQQLWTFDFDAGRKTHAVYQVAFIRYERSACFVGEWCIVRRPNGAIADNIREDQLFRDRDDATEGMIANIKAVRKDMRLDIEYHTKAIARDWNSIDYCTGVIEELEDDK